MKLSTLIHLVAILTATQVHADTAKKAPSAPNTFKPTAKFTKQVLRTISTTVITPLTSATC